MSHPRLAVVALLSFAANCAAEPLSLELQGIARRAEIQAPAAGSEQRALVLALHGLRQPVEHLRRDLGLEAIAERDGFVVAYPEGIDARWNYGRQLSVPMRMVGASEVDDVAFLRALIARLTVSHHIDRKRVYLIGVSNGAMMAYRAACEMDRELAAVA